MEEAAAAADVAAEKANIYLVPTSPYRLLNSAKKNLEKTEDRSFKYACLDLRECIETITYEKIALRHKMIPESYFKRWQPIALFKVLELLHPESLEEYSVSIGKEITPGIAVRPTCHIGTHRTFSMKWLKTYYHKLGSYLHATRTTPAETQKERKSRFLEEKIANAEARKNLEKIIEKLEEIVRNELDITICEPIKLTCPVCKKDMYIDKNIIGKLGNCIDCSMCGAGLKIKITKQQEYMLQPALTPISCDCKKEFLPPLGTLYLGNLFECPHCKDKYRVTRIEYGKLTVQKEELDKIEDQL